MNDQPRLSQTVGSRAVTRALYKKQARQATGLYSPELHACSEPSTYAVQHDAHGDSLMRRPHVSGLENRSGQSPSLRNFSASRGQAAESSWCLCLVPMVGPADDEDVVVLRPCWSTSTWLVPVRPRVLIGAIGVAACGGVSTG